MSAVRGEAWILDLPMEEPYSISYASADTARNVIVRLETASGLVGFGCGAPDPDVTGETVEGTLSAVNDFLLGGSLDDKPSALHAVEMAAWDLVGKEAGLPLYRIFGAVRERILTSITIGILPEAETVSRARDWVKQGFRCLKLKGGCDWEADAARVRLVREAVGREIFLRFDANQGYGAEDTRRFAEVAGPDIEFIEQPSRVGESLLSTIPVMADESLLTVEDARRLDCPLFNLKLTKVGGLSRARAIERVMQDRGIHGMVGCMDESALGIAAGLHFALSSPVVRYADLDGHIGLNGDPFKDAVRVDQGFCFPSEGAGWGA